MPWGFSFDQTRFREVHKQKSRAWRGFCASDPGEPTPDLHPSMGSTSCHLALPAGFEPAILALRGLCPRPLDEGSIDRFTGRYTNHKVVKKTPGCGVLLSALSRPRPPNQRLGPLSRSEPAILALRGLLLRTAPERRRSMEPTRRADVRSPGRSLTFQPLAAPASPGTH